MPNLVTRGLGAGNGLNTAGLAINPYEGDVVVVEPPVVQPPLFPDDHYGSPIEEDDYDLKFRRDFEQFHNDSILCEVGDDEIFRCSTRSYFTGLFDRESLVIFDGEVPIETFVTFIETSSKNLNGVVEGEQFKFEGLTYKALNPKQSGRGTVRVDLERCGTCT